MRAARERLDSYAASVIAVRPDGFWDKQRVDNYCTKAHGDGEVSERASLIKRACMCVYIRIRV